MTTNASPEPVSTMPDCTIIPVIYYPDVPLAIDWLCATFHFRERWRIASHRAQLAFGNGVIAVAEQKPDQLTGTSRPSQSILMRVPDIHALYRHCLDCGVEILQEPEDHFYGERQFRVKDFAGHWWTFTETIKLTTPEDWGATSAGRQ